MSEQQYADRPPEGYEKTVINSGLSKQDYLNIIRLLSALESWGMTTAAMHKTPFPDYLLEELGNSLEILEKEVLK